MEATNLIGQLQAAGYAAPTFLGKGAFSEVWRVLDKETGQFFACKISDDCERAEREAMMLKELSSPLFPKYVKAWQAQGKRYLLMEYIPGRNLKELLQYRGRFTQRQAVRIAMEIAKGILDLHERSAPILFRDIKPENVIIRQDGRVKLVDAGCVCRLENTGAGHRVTSGTHIAGSRGYSAPEQFQPEAALGVESDVYAMGSLLLYMLTGKNVWETTVHGAAKGLRISGGLLHLTELALQEERQRRIPDMRTLLQKLSVYDGGHWKKRMGTDIKALFHRQKASDFYYIVNIREGLDRRK